MSEYAKCRGRYLTSEECPQYSPMEKLDPTVCLACMLHHALSSGSIILEQLIQDKTEFPLLVSKVIHIQNEALTEIREGFKKFLQGNNPRLLQKWFPKKKKP